MKRLLTKKLLVLTAIFASVSLFSTEEQMPQDKVINQGHGINENQMKGAYNATARFGVRENCDMFMNISVLYWQAKQQNLDLALVQFLPVNLSQPTADYVTHYDFDYLPGFKVGLGFDFLHDNWNIFAEYTRLHGDTDKVVNNPNPIVRTISNVLPLLRQAVTDYEKVEGTYDIKVDLIDLQLARPYYAGTQLTIEPHFGLRTGWLKQHVNSYNFFFDRDPSLGLEEIFYTHSKAWLIGPRFGLNSSWHLGAGFRICANASAGLYHQHMKVKILSYSEAVYSSNVISTWSAHKYYQIVPSAEAGLGLAWGMYLDDHKYHLDISALYDFVCFWNQGAIRSLYDEAAVLTGHHVNTTPGNFIMQGLTANVRLDF